MVVVRLEGTEDPPPIPEEYVHGIPRYRKFRSDGLSLLNASGTVWNFEENPVF